MRYTSAFANPQIALVQIDIAKSEAFQKGQRLNVSYRIRPARPACHMTMAAKVDSRTYAAPLCENPLNRPLRSRCQYPHARYVATCEHQVVEHPHGPSLSPLTSEIHLGASIPTRRSAVRSTPRDGLSVCAVFLSTGDPPFVGLPVRAGCGGRSPRRLSSFHTEVRSPPYSEQAG